MLLSKENFNEKIENDLNYYEGKVYKSLLSFKNKNSNIISPKISDISQKSGLSRCTVMKYIKTLKEKGYLYIEKQKFGCGNKNVYTLNIICNSQSHSGEYEVTDYLEVWIQQFMKLK